MFYRIAISALLLGASTISASAYSAIAGGTDGLGFGTGATKDEAIAAARQHCLDQGFTCYGSQIAGGTNWYYSGMMCGGLPYVATTQQSFGRADDINRTVASSRGHVCTHFQHFKR